jgi:hypothetical protein
MIQDEANAQETGVGEEEGRDVVAKIGAREQDGDGQIQTESVIRLVWHLCARREAFCDECCGTGRLPRRWPLSLGRLDGAEEGGCTTQKQMSTRTLDSPLMPR